MLADRPALLKSSGASRRQAPYAVLRGRLDVAGKSTNDQDPSEAGAGSGLATTPAMPAAPQTDAIWTSVLWFFLEGFALYGASLHGLATTAVTAITSEVDVRRSQESWRQRRKSISLVSSSAGAGAVPEPEDGIGQTAFDSRKPSAADTPMRGVQRSIRRGWLSRAWRTIARR